MILGNKILIALVLLVYSNISNSCLTANKDLYKPYSELISSANAIYLAKLRNKEDFEEYINVPKKVREKLPSYGNQKRNFTRYSFEITESIYGDKKDEILLEYLASQYESGGDFDSHTDYRFWLDNNGRLKLRRDCNLDYSFEIGKVYLLILTNSAHVKMFEKIESMGDPWLIEVKRISEMRKVLDKELN